MSKFGSVLPAFNSCDWFSKTKGRYRHIVILVFQLTAIWKPLQRYCPVSLNEELASNDMYTRFRQSFYSRYLNQEDIAC